MRRSMQPEPSSFTASCRCVALVFLLALEMVNGQSLQLGVGNKTACNNNTQPGGIPIATPTRKPISTKVKPIKRQAVCSACPSYPLDACMFIFYGNLRKIPTLSLGSTQGHVISRAILLVSPVNSAFRAIPIAISGQAVDYCSGTTLGNQFYLDKYKGGMRVFTRTFQAQPGIASFANQCVKLNIPSAAVSYNSKTLYLNPGDGSKRFPESKRCIMFKTSA